MIFLKFVVVYITICVVAVYTSPLPNVSTADPGLEHFTDTPTERSNWNGYQSVNVTGTEKTPHDIEDSKKSEFDTVVGDSEADFNKTNETPSPPNGLTSPQPTQETLDPLDSSYGIGLGLEYDNDRLFYGAYIAMSSDCYSVGPSIPGKPGATRPTCKPGSGCKPAPENRPVCS